MNVENTGEIEDWKKNVKGLKSSFGKIYTKEYDFFYLTSNVPFKYSLWLDSAVKSRK